MLTRFSVCLRTTAAAAHAMKTKWSDVDGSHHSKIEVYVVGRILTAKYAIPILQLVVFSVFLPL